MIETHIAKATIVQSLWHSQPLSNSAGIIKQSCRTLVEPGLRNLQRTEDRLPFWSTCQAQLAQQSSSGYQKTTQGTAELADLVIRQHSKQVLPGLWLGACQAAQFLDYELGMLPTESLTCSWHSHELARPKTATASAVELASSNLKLRISKTSFCLTQNSALRSLRWLQSPRPLVGIPGWCSNAASWAMLKSVAAVTRITLDHSAFKSWRLKIISSVGSADKSRRECRVTRTNAILRLPHC